MNSRSLLAILAVLAVAAAVAVWRWGAGGPSVDAEPGAAPSEPVDAEMASTPARSNARIDELQTRLASAVADREAAEAALAASEKELVALEAYVAEIEARGEDPADYAGEGVERFQPAFFRFQDAMAAFEAAEQAESDARAALAAARADDAAESTRSP